MKKNRSFDPHLVLKSIGLPPGGEWEPAGSGWLLIWVVTGVAYWMNPRVNLELVTGSVLLRSKRVGGTIRASQLGGAVLNYFFLEPEKLTGLFTLVEQQSLEKAASSEPLSLRVLSSRDPAAESFKRIAVLRDLNSLSVRLQLLSLFVESLGPGFQVLGESTAPSGTKKRLREFLSRMSEAELLELDFMELAGTLCCTPRHLSRTFQEVVGMSFRDKQTELRLARAKDLLATSQSKVVEVALESGYQSLSLFNLMFKKRFGITPGKWREQALENRSNAKPSRMVALRS